MKIKNVLFNESKFFDELKMKIYASPNQNSIEFIFIEVLFVGRLVGSEEID